MSALFSPIRLAGLELANRIAVSPMCQYSAVGGDAGDWHITHLGMFANSGAGLVVIEMTDVEPEGRISTGCLGLYSDTNERALARVIAHCKQIGQARIGVQLAHAGRKASMEVPWSGAKPLPPERGGWATIGPSPIAPGEGWPAPREMTDADFNRVREAFVSAAKRAVRAGIDAIELHAAHGYLLHSFLSPISNRRSDSYGGSLESRMRFPAEVAQAVRTVVPNNVALGVRLTGDDWTEGGISSDEAVAHAQMFKDAGLDYVDVSSGGIAFDTRNPTTPAYNAPLAEKVRRATGLPTRTVGLIMTPQQAEDVVVREQADMVALGRAMLDDPHWGWHAARALGAEIVRPKQYLRAGPQFWPGAKARA